MRGILLEMSPLRSLGVVFVAVLQAGCAATGGVPSEAFGDPIAERLVVAPYPAQTLWKEVTDRHTRDGSLLEWVPADQERNGARDVLAQQTFFRPRDVSALELARDLAKRIALDCEVARTDGPRPGTEDGNDVAYAEVTCSRGSGSTRDAQYLLKVIRGHEALYLAQREFGYEPSAAQLRQANAFLADQVALCPLAGGIGRCARRVAR
jgi:hypothetical protein